MYSTRGMGDDLRSTVVRGLALARALGGGDREVRLLAILHGYLIRTGDWSEALEVAKQSMTAARVAETAGTLRAHWMLALSHHCCGNHARAQEHCEVGLRLAATSREEPMLHFRVPQVRLTLARTLWLRGKGDHAAAIAHQVIDDAISLQHPIDKCGALLTVRTALCLARRLVRRGAAARRDGRTCPAVLAHVPSGRGDGATR